ncbi:hypothetical protein GIB67_014306 [Kingdonia uniflora]|uniref:Transcription factor bHLH140 n=1 Tax=Kingdonia uniflora TaxID=39325 RepID=A0A7J7NT68_9MAGN|nr:hypothetical protein GIB67_014306 [Kingdonia uniflora]
MEIDSETNSNEKKIVVEKEEDEKSNKDIVVVLMGAPGSGKSTFCEHVMNAARRPWVRVCQDTIANGKAGTKAQCVKSAVEALKSGKCVFIDRCNLEREQRSEFVKLEGLKVDVHAVVLDLPARICISRSVKRTGHEGNLQGGKAAAVVNRMLLKKELPKLSEGFSRITYCQSESDVEDAVSVYKALGPLDILAPGCYGQKKPDAKIQLGIMRFLKKVEVPETAGSTKNSAEDAIPKQETKEPSSKESETVTLPVENEDVEMKKDVPTLAFPSISTSDFQFNLDKASDIIVEKVDEFLGKIGNARLALVDLSHRSKILSLVKEKAVKKNIDSAKFLTFVGDITQLYTEGGLRCTIIANAANWRLKPGGGGVNAAIFNAAGPDLEIATKEIAGSLSPGRALVVPLPSTSALYRKEGVTHVIHVLGPNMNPDRPNFLNNDYDKGCKVLREAYSSLFDGFASTLSNQATKSASGSMDLDKYSLEKHPGDHFPSTNIKNKREDAYEHERIKKSRGLKNATGNEDGMSYATEKKPEKTWGSWSLALYNIAMNPERHKNILIEILDDVVVLNDLYPKAEKHLLVLARKDGLDRLADVREEHLPLLKTMHDVGEKWAKKFLSEDPSLIFRLGYHSDPSMRQLHLHVISQDFNSTHLKNKKHWNSFNSLFFLDSVNVIEEISKHGRPKLNDGDNLLAMELRCHRCRSAHPNIPRLKSHISKCQAPIPATLLENDCLVLAESGAVSQT